MSRYQELELRIETQKQTLAARDESIKKLMEMMQNKGIGSKMMEEERMEIERLRSRNIELETRLRHTEHLLETKEKELIKVCINVSNCDHGWSAKFVDYCRFNSCKNYFKNMSSLNR